MVYSPAFDWRVPSLEREALHFADGVMPEPSELLLQYLPRIEQIIVSICRRKGVDADAMEEFAAEVKLRLVEDDYAVIREFKNRSTFPVYIAAVIRRFLLDFRNREWGKWRASAEAQRLGPLAIELERLLHREHRSLVEVLPLLASKYPEVTPEQLKGIANRLPPRLPKRKVDFEEVEAPPAPERIPEPIRNETARRLSVAVKRFIDGLGEDDQLLLELRFHVGLTVAKIARSLQRDQTLLYRRLYRLFEELRAELGKTGIAAKDVEELIGSDPPLLDFGWKNDDQRPSKDGESAVAGRQEETS